MLFKGCITDGTFKTVLIVPDRSVISDIRAGTDRITLILSDEIEVSDEKLCVYENAQRSKSVKVAKSAPCHYTKTFNTGV